MAAWYYEGNWYYVTGEYASWMTLLVNRGYKDFQIYEFAVYGNVMAVVMQHKETGEGVRLEYLTSHKKGCEMMDEW